MENPLSSVVAVRTKLVAVSVTVIDAFGTTAPWLSCTVPEIRPKIVCPCMLRLAQIINKSTAQISAEGQCFDDDSLVLRISVSSNENSRPKKTYRRVLN